jgi:hypothetical protein
VERRTLKIKLTLELSFINIPPFFSLFLQKWKVISTFLNKKKVTVALLIIVDVRFASTSYYVVTTHDTQLLCMSMRCHNFNSEPNLKLYAISTRTLKQDGETLFYKYNSFFLDNSIKSKVNSAFYL